jgi:hypothetical protein
MVMIAISTSSAFSENLEFIEVARECHDYLVDNNYYYESSWQIYPVSTQNGHYIDCSGYVGWAIYEYQNGNYECQSATWYLSTAKKLFSGKETDYPQYTAGWTAVKGSENFEPGDILCYPHHVHIYVSPDPEEEGRYLVLNAGSDEALDLKIQSIRGDYFRKAEYAIRLP